MFIHSNISQDLDETSHHSHLAMIIPFLIRALNPSSKINAPTKPEVAQYGSRYWIDDYGLSIHAELVTASRSVPPIILCRKDPQSRLA